MGWKLKVEEIGISALKKKVPSPLWEKVNASHHGNSVFTTVYRVKYGFSNEASFKMTTATAEKKQTSHMWIYNWEKKIFTAQMWSLNKEGKNRCNYSCRISWFVSTGGQVQTLYSFLSSIHFCTALLWWQAQLPWNNLWKRYFRNSPSWPAHNCFFNRNILARFYFHLFQHF